MPCPNCDLPWGVEALQPDECPLGDEGGKSVWTDEAVAEIADRLAFCPNRVTIDRPPLRPTSQLNVGKFETSVANLAIFGCTPQAP